jgi:tetratricopeptide (TPR) repeat protein
MRCEATTLFSNVTRHLRGIPRPIGWRRILLLVVTPALAFLLARSLAAQSASPPEAETAAPIGIAESSRGELASARSHFERGLVLKSRPLRKLAAIRAFREALREDPSSLDVLYEFVDTYLELDGWEGQREARRGLVEILKREPFYRDAYDRWQSLYVSTRENAEVAEVFRTRLERRFDPSLAARCAALYIQNSSLDELDELLANWRSREAPGALYSYYRARWLFLLGRDAEAPATYQEGLRSARDDADLAPYRQDLAPLIPLGEEPRSFASIKHEAVEIGKFWDVRDPLPFSPVNERLAEQYRRIEEARKRYLWKKPIAKASTIGETIDDLGRPSFDTQLEGRSLDDRGTVYLRHGEPDVRQLAIGPGGNSSTSAFGAGEYWRYERGDLPDGRLQVHFKLMDGPLARGNDMVYSILPTTDIGAANVPVGHAGSEGVEQTLLFLETDSYAFDYGKSFFPLTLSTVTFRNREDPALTDVFFVATPAGQVGHGEGEEVELVARVKLHSGARTEEVTAMDTVLATARDIAGVGGVSRFSIATQLSTAPGERSYGVQLDVFPTEAYGVARGELAVPSYAERELQLSDLMLAASVTSSTTDEGEGGQRVVRAGHELEPLPAGRQRPGRPVHVFYEVYDLARDVDGKSRYRVRYRIVGEDRDRPGFFERIFGSRDEGVRSTGANEVSLAFDNERPSSSDRQVETISLDFSQLPAGRYSIEVTVEDLLGGGAARRKAALELEEEP